LDAAPGPGHCIQALDGNLLLAFFTDPERSIRETSLCGANLPKQLAVPIQSLYRLVAGILEHHLLYFLGGLFNCNLAFIAQLLKECRFPAT
jgi:hypothetical protein